MTPSRRPRETIERCDRRVRKRCCARPLYVRFCVRRRLQHRWSGLCVVSYCVNRSPFPAVPLHVSVVSYRERAWVEGWWMRGATIVAVVIGLVPPPPPPLRWILFRAKRSRPSKEVRAALFACARVFSGRLRWCAAVAQKRTFVRRRTRRTDRVTSSLKPCPSRVIIHPHREESVDGCRMSSRGAQDTFIIRRLSYPAVVNGS